MKTMSDEKKNYFVVDRGLLSSDRWLNEPFTRGQAWVDMFGLANHADGFIRVRGIKILIKRGQLGWSQLKLSKRWKWSRNKVRRFLKELEKEGDISLKTIQQNAYATTVITVVKYNQWQLSGTPNETPKGHQKDTKRYSNKKNKKNKKNKNLNIIATSSPDNLGVAVNEIISIFQKINPTIKYENKTERLSAEHLVEKVGAKKTIKMAKYAVKIMGEEYAPTISTPRELEKNIAKLSAYKKREMKSNKVTII